MKILILFTLMLSFHARANLLKLQGDEVEILTDSFSAKDAIWELSKIRKSNVIFVKKFYDFTVHIAGTRKFKLDDFENFVGQKIYDAGYTRLKRNNGKLWSIINARDVRFELEKPIEDLSEEQQKSSDFYFLKYKIKNSGGIDFARWMRGLISRNARTIQIEQGALLTVHETGVNLKAILKMVKLLDTPSVVEDVKAVKEMNRKNTKSFWRFGRNKMSKEQIYFWPMLLAFLIMGGLLGFITRGYLIKRIEGGL